MAIRVTQPEFNIKEKIKDSDYELFPYDKMPPGSIIQVVNNPVHEIDNISITADNYANIQLLDTTIIPRFENSKFMISCHVFGEGADNEHQFAIKLNRKIGRNDHRLDAEQEGEQDVEARLPTLVVFPQAYFDANNSTTPVVAAISNYVDCPKLTANTPITYRIIIANNASTTKNFNLNHTVSDTSSFGSERGTSWMTIMEIKA
jgi:hypothetical protein